MQVGDDDGRGEIARQDPGAISESAPAPATTMLENSELLQDGPHRAPPYQTRMISGEELLSSVAYGWDLVKDMPDGKFLIGRKAVYI